MRTSFYELGCNDIFFGVFKLYVDKQVAFIEKGMIWIDEELYEKQDMEEIKQVIRHKFENLFGIKLVDSRPSESEKKMAQELLPKCMSGEWTYRL